MLGKLWRVLQAKLKELEEGTLVSYTPPKLFACCQRHMHAPQPRPRRLSWSSPPSPPAFSSRPSGPRRSRGGGGLDERLRLHLSTLLSASLTDMYGSIGLASPGGWKVQRPPQRKAVQKAPEGAPYLQPLLRCDGAGRILLRSSTKTCRSEQRSAYEYRTKVDFCFFFSLCKATN